MDYVKPLMDLDRADYNCYGLVLYVNRAVNKLEWATEEVFTDFLRRCTVGTAVPKKGDIIVCYDPMYEIMHSAIYMGNGNIVHKPGSLDICISGIYEGLYDMYNSSYIEFRRVINKQGR